MQLKPYNLIFSIIKQNLNFNCMLQCQTKEQGPIKANEVLMQFGVPTCKLAIKINIIANWLLFLYGERTIQQIFISKTSEQQTPQDCKFFLLFSGKNLQIYSYRGIKKSLSRGFCFGGFIVYGMLILVQFGCPCLESHNIFYM